MFHRVLKYLIFFCLSTDLFAGSSMVVADSRSKVSGWATHPPLLRRPSHTSG